MRTFSETWRGNLNYSGRETERSNRMSRSYSQTFTVLIVSVLGHPLNKKKKVSFESWMGGTNERVCSHKETPAKGTKTLTGRQLCLQQTDRLLLLRVTVSGVLGLRWRGAPRLSLAQAAARPPMLV